MNKPIKQEPKPLVRLRGANGQIVYPKMIPDGKGGWKLENPGMIGAMLSTPISPNPSTKLK